MQLGRYQTLGGQQALGRRIGSFEQQNRRLTVVYAKKKAPIGKLKLTIEAGKANPAPPIGPALGSWGLNIMGFCKEYNAATAQRAGETVPVEITVFEDRTYTFQLMAPPTSKLLLKAAGIEKGSHTGRLEVVGSVTYDQLKEIVDIKRQEIDVNTWDSAAKSVVGTAMQMGVAVKGLPDHLQHPKMKEMAGE